MAKCDLSIELDDPKRLHPGGGKITGVLRVDADKDVNCKGLEIKSLWKTHGRGNVASGVAETQTLFAGQWRAGQQEEYRFELDIADWPPSYHGSYLNVDHYVEARAKIPWGFDPKASEPFLMRPTCGPEGAAVKNSATELGKTAGCIIGLVIMCIFSGIAVAMFQSMGIFALLFVIVPGMIGGTIWFLKVFLPKWALGEVTCELNGDVFSPGENVTGELCIRPKKDVSINGVSMIFRAAEVCISGSGSNQTTHTNVFIENDETLQDSTVLKAGTENRFPISIAVPADAPYSLTLSDNKITWTTNLRVDIPRWPDWTKDLAISVVPSGEPFTEPPEPAEEQQNIQEPAAITFAETATHLWAVRDDVEQVDGLVDAVTGLTMDVEAHVERRLLYSGDEDPHVYKDGYAVWARHTDPPLPLVLYVPRELADDFEQAGRDKWMGRGTIVGWDHEHRRLQIKLERPV